MKRHRFTEALLWFFVLSAALISGGNLFDNLVLIPLWAGSPPESVTTWTHGTVQSSFFFPVGGAYLSASLLLLIFCWGIPQPDRKWLLMASVSGLLIMVWSVTFFIPILIRTEGPHGAGLSSEQIMILTHRYVFWNWVRLVTLAGTFIAGVYALVQVASARGKEA